MNVLRDITINSINIGVTWLATIMMDVNLTSTQLQIAHVFTNAIAQMDFYLKGKTCTANVLTCSIICMTIIGEAWLAII